MNQDEMAQTTEGATTESVETSQVSPQQKPAPAERQAPDRLQRFLRRMSIWLAILVVVFFAGAITDHYLRYVPLSESFFKTRVALDQANQELSNLQAEVNTLEANLKEADDRLRTLDSENKTLQDELGRAETRLDLLQVLIDINNARLALYQEDIEGAKAALADTPQRLEDLLPRIREVSSNLAESLPQRLNLILSGLERDNLETVQIDLELFTKELLDIESSAFGE